MSEYSHLCILLQNVTLALMSISSILPLSASPWRTLGVKLCPQSCSFALREHVSATLSDLLLSV